ncbi:glycine--tRNA ligase subunit beta [Aestuariibacter halophilus]|uniref:Glycine--tRNA ligase beta subunit n=1 Tax=Fluctibacter halophilus TaxID=226011 RepID=A0ABS8G8K5_9ALTE|nr:glycine--tRNA ligase subunit beta [Aestuariibacter halophilus]MCC2616917.1 glycine--tRNA ligase subunit beta [Aestuariibacter halophilus]
MQTDNLIVELGTEELPPKALTQLGSAFAQQLTSALDAANLSHGDVTWYAAPRRLAVAVAQLAEQQPDSVVEKRGPAVTAAYDADGKPTKAAEGWARSNGISVEQAERLKTDKGEWLLHKADIKGQSLDVLLADLVEGALKKLPIPKPMRWGSKSTQFIRPVHSLTMLYGDRVVPGSVLGLTSARTVFGHRFHGDKQFELDHADSYLKALESQYVLADFGARKEKIRQGLLNAAQQEGATADIDESLLEEVTALVEWPVILKASFDEAFLSVPKEALIYTMKDDQKYFPLLDQNGNLLPRFLFVSNIESQDPQQVIHGNEKVIRPRLADAKFFFDTDKKTTLASRVASLQTVLFQKQLGTLADKSARIAALAGKIATSINANAEDAKRAGELCKTDLMTNMVMEFPDVQGVMGMHYARIDGENEAVAVALNEQYMPRFAGDELPRQGVSQALALADKLDTLVGIFGIGQLPKGDKDPFALRRAAIGVLRIIVECNLDLDLVNLIADSQALFADKLTNPDTSEQVVDFILGRFRAWYQEQGVEIDVIQAVAARRPTKPADYAARIAGVTQFKAHPEAEALAAANKRVANILAKNDVTTTQNVDNSLFESDEERRLADALQQVEAAITTALANGQYGQVLTQLASLRAPVDGFFDNVMVMAEDVAVRNNRLALLAKLRSLFLHTADISLLNQASV